MNSVVNYILTDDIGVVTVNNPPVNALSHAVRQGLLDAFTRAAEDESDAVLLICDGRTFIAGADIAEFGKPLQEPWLPDLYKSIEALDKPVISAIHGTALGGGFEAALATHYRCALASARVGLPEVKLGLLPGAGGTQRAPRLAGVRASLDLMTSGVPLPAPAALEAGLIDKIIDGDLREGALAWARELVAAGRGVRRTSEQSLPGFDVEVFDQYRAALAKRARGQVAPQSIVDCVEAAATMPFDEGLAFERDRFLALMQGKQSGTPASPRRWSRSMMRRCSAGCRSSSATTLAASRAASCPGRRRQKIGR